MVPGPYRIRAVFFLLAFALGGLALPVAHQVDHFLDLKADAPLHETPVVSAAHTAPFHDCALCEVRLAAVVLEAPDETAVDTVPLGSSTAPEQVSLASTRPFDGRAPPVLS